MNIFLPILKVDSSRREVHGVMAEEAKDRAGETFDYFSSKPYVLAWSKEIEKTTDGKSVGNVRGQHGKIAAGKLVSITFDDAAKRVSVIAKIVDNNEWEKVVSGTYSGFSIGGSYIKKWEDGGTTRYTAKPAEVSLVDFPCMYGSTFTLIKADGVNEEKNFHAGISNINATLEGLLKQFAGNRVATTTAPAARFVPGGVEKAGVAEIEFLRARLNRITIRP
jgi:hypothetical protein